MTNETFKDIEKLESDLWEAADNLRANSKLTSSDYFMPVLGVIFLRHAANRFEAATRQIKEDQTAGRMPKRKVLPADYLRRPELWLPVNATKPIGVATYRIVKRLPKELKGQLPGMEEIAKLLEEGR